MFLIFEHHYEPSSGMMVMNEDGSNMLFESREEALAYAEENCIHVFVIVEV